MKSFVSDKEGITKSDFEKLVLGILLIVVVITICAIYFIKNVTDPNMLYLATSIGALFVVRKATAYNRDIKISNNSTDEAEDTK